MPFLTLFSIAIFWALMSFGNWQWQRYQSKLAIEAAPQVIATEQMALNFPRDFMQVKLKGELSEKVIRVFATANGQTGYRHFGQLSTLGRNYLVDLGWLNEADSQKFRQIRKDVNIEGVLRAHHQPNRFTPPNQPEKHRYYWPDLTELAGEFPNQTYQEFYVAVLNSDLNNSGNPISNPWADAKGANYIEPARHLGYALTWWGLAIGLIGVYIAMHIKANRLKLR